MRTIGRKGGQVTQYEPLVEGLSGSDARLRRHAQKRLGEMLDSDNPRIALRAAIALGAFSPERPEPSANFKGSRLEYAGIPSSEVLKILQAAGREKP